ncbi:hypothetical protein KU6B_23250 [Mameliella alba]|nr:hypothetical protein KU6B_23250 [Mameliella alba]
MMRMLAAGLDCPVEPVEKAGLDGDMLEAQAFAYLAVRVARGLPTSAPDTTGVAAPVGADKSADLRASRDDSRLRRVPAAEVFIAQRNMGSCKTPAP